MTPEQQSLFDAYQAGDPDHSVEGRLVESLMPVAKSAARPVLRRTPRCDADDLLQHLRLAVLRGVRAWRPGPTKITSLVWTCVRNALRDWMDGRRRAARCISLPILPAAAAGNPEIERMELREEFSRRIAELPPVQQRVVTVVFYGELTQREVAGELGLDEKMVSKLKLAALDAVKRRMIER